MKAKKMVLAATFSLLSAMPIASFAEELGPVRALLVDLRVAFGLPEEGVLRSIFDDVQESLAPQESDNGRSYFDIRTEGDTLQITPQEDDWEQLGEDIEQGWNQVF